MWGLMLRRLFASYCVFLFLLSICAFAQNAPLLHETPKAADSLVDSVGVNIHMTYWNTAYGNLAAVQSMLTTLGVRHVRDGAKYYASDPGYGIQEYEDYGAVSSLGIGFDLILTQGTSPNPLNTAGMAMLQGLAASQKVKVDFYEGPNEVDIQGDGNWIADTRSFMQQVYPSIKANPGSSKIPVLGNSLAGAGSDWAALGNMTAYENFGNLHPYANTQYPSYNFATDAAQQAAVSGAQTIYVTESGWSNAMEATDDSPNVTEDVSSRYVGRLFFETLLHGWPRTYVYELVDEDPDPGLTNTQQHFGLFRNDYSAKPAATVVANLISLMSDKGAAVAPVILTYTLETTSGNVHHLLFQKRDGSYWLALWQEVSDWSGWNAQGTPIVNAEVPVTLTLQKEAASIEEFLPLQSTEVAYSFSGRNTVTLMVPDYPLLVEISFGSKGGKAARPAGMPE